LSNPCFRASLKHWQNAKKLLSITWVGSGTQTAVWDVLVFFWKTPDHLHCPKSLQGVGIRSSFLPEDSCPTVSVRSAQYVLHRVYLKVISLF